MRSACPAAIRIICRGSHGGHARDNNSLSGNIPRCFATAARPEHYRSLRYLRHAPPANRCSYQQTWLERGDRGRRGYSRELLRLWVFALASQRRKNRGKRSARPAAIIYTRVPICKRSHLSRAGANLGETSAFSNAFPSTAKTTDFPVRENA